MNQEITLITAFTAGFLSFFAPCILPLIPAYFAYLLGVAQDEVKKEKFRLKILLHSIFLVLGFSIIFIILGLGASSLGQVFASYRLLLQKIGGLLLIFFGLYFIGVFKKIKQRQDKFLIKLFAKINNKTSSFLVGAVFAFAWVACFSPILGSILVLSSFQGSLRSGARLLSLYSLGLAIPFVLSSYFISFTVEKTRQFSSVIRVLNLSSGLILISMGTLFLSDNFYKVVALLNKAYAHL